MKKISFALCMTLGLSFAFAQAPQAFKYQAVARDASGNELATTALSVRSSIHDLTAGGTVVYQETQAVTTNAFGLFSTNLGQGTATIGTFAGINWAGGSKYLQQEVDFGTGYQNMGTSELLSVPYALSAPGTIPNGTAAGNTLYWNGTNWVANSSNIFNNGANVGIGMPTPIHTLEVAGNSYASTGFETPASKGYAYSTAKTHYLSVPATAFNEQGGYPVGRYLNGNASSVCTFGGTAGNVALLFASVNLPDSATITKITAYIADNDAVNSAAVSMIAISNTTGNPSMFVSTPTSTATAISPYFTAFGHLVNNAVETYSLRFETFESNPDLLLYNVVIEYTVLKAD